MFDHDLMSASISDDTVAVTVTALWERTFGSAAGLELTPCAVGGNNRVYMVRVGTRTAVAKWYYPGAPEARDRLEAEWRFLSYAAAVGITCVPQPLARDDRARLALHQVRHGKKVARATVGRDALAQAADFFVALNAGRAHPAAGTLMEAAEACFSPTAHMALLDSRLSRLATITSADTVGRQAAGLVAELTETWRAVRTKLRQALKTSGFDPDADLTPEQRCISPSDFGFHNALVDSDGVISFIDFEYGGWDDPAKMIADFFLQPAVPVDPCHRDWFFKHTVGTGTDAARVAERARLLHPLFALKWCCIMLNPFLPDRAGRSRFAQPTHDEHDRKVQRLAAAGRAFDSIKGNN